MALVFTGAFQGTGLKKFISRPGEADWGLWAEMPKAEVWQAVLLSCDLSPDERAFGFNWLNGSQNQRALEDSEIHTECSRRLQIVTAHLSYFRGPLKIINRPAYGLEDPRGVIGLHEFASWAGSKGWSLPRQFPGASSTLSSSIDEVEAAAIDPSDFPLELDAANTAFRAITNGYGLQIGTARNRLIDFLRKNYPDFNSEQVQRIATVANPDKTTGRKKR